MANEVITYITTKRAAKVSDDTIRTNLLAQGWPTEQVEAALKADLTDDIPAPPAATAGAGVMAAQPMSPAPVVSSFSTISVEYIIMFIGLWISATTIGLLLHTLIDSMVSQGLLEGILPMATAALVVALPIFGFMFARLRRKEANDPAVRQDASRKQAIRLTLLVTFVTAIGHIISYIYSLLAPMSTSYDSYGSTSAINAGTIAMTNFLHVLVTLIIAGGIFMYYWRDIHRSEQSL